MLAELRNKYSYISRASLALAAIRSLGRSLASHHFFLLLACFDVSLSGVAPGTLLGRADYESSQASSGIYSRTFEGKS